MAAAGFFEMVFLFLLPVGGGSDLLDFVPTDAYWKSKTIAVTGESMLAELGFKDVPDISPLIAQLGDEEFAQRDAAARKIRSYGGGVIPQLETAAKSTDAEIAGQARRLIERFRTTAEQRLMAIRTLGEIKYRDGLPSLRKLLDNKDPFVVEYAKQAIGAIEGKPVARPRPTREQLDEDVWLLPKNCGVVAQLAMHQDSPLKLDDFYKRLRGMPGFDADAVTKQVNAALRSITEQIGNARIDAITMGLADAIGHDKAAGRDRGFVVFVVRGLYNRDALREFLKTKGLSATRKDGIDYLAIADEAQLVLVSNERLLFIAGPSEETLPIAEMVSAARTGKGELAKNEALSKIIRSIERPQAIWLAATITDAYKEEKFFKPFDVFTAVVKQDGRALKGKLVVTGSDAELMETTWAEFDKDLKKSLTEFEDVVGMFPLFKPMLDVMKSIKRERSGATITVTAEMADMTDLLIMPMMFGFAFGGGF